MATVAPCEASTCAKRQPRPEVAPVTRVVWPDKSVESLGSGKSVILGALYYVGLFSLITGVTVLKNVQTTPKLIPLVPPEMSATLSFSKFDLDVLLRAGSPLI